AEALGVAGHGGLEDFADLALQRGVLVHQVAAVAAQQLDRPVVVGPGRLPQAEAVGGGAADGGQVGVVGLVARVGGLAVLLGGEGVGQAGRRSRLGGGGWGGGGGFPRAWWGGGQVAP